MGFYSEIWIEVIELAEEGYDADQIAAKINDRFGHEVITAQQVDNCIVEYVQDTQEGA